MRSGMNDVQRKIIAGILIVILAISCLALSLYYDAFYAAPSRYQVRYETLSSVFIPDQMSGIRILYFSDESDKRTAVRPGFKTGPKKIKNGDNLLVRVFPDRIRDGNTASAFKRAGALPANILGQFLPSSGTVPNPIRREPYQKIISRGQLR